MVEASPLRFRHVRVTASQPGGARSGRSRGLAIWLRRAAGRGRVLEWEPGVCMGKTPTRSGRCSSSLLSEHRGIHWIVFGATVWPMHCTRWDVCWLLGYDDSDMIATRSKLRNFRLDVVLSRFYAKRPRTGCRWLHHIITHFMARDDVDIFFKCDIRCSTFQIKCNDGGRPLTLAG